MVEGVAMKKNDNTSEITQFTDDMILSNNANHEQDINIKLLPSCYEFYIDN